MAGNSSTDKELQAIHKELKEANRRLDRLCRASIFSLDTPVIKVQIEYIPKEGENHISKEDAEKILKEFVSSLKL